jgi:hypothetical protein
MVTLRVRADLRGDEADRIVAAQGDNDGRLAALEAR